MYANENGGRILQKKYVRYFTVLLRHNWRNGRMCRNKIKIQLTEQIRDCA